MEPKPKRKSAKRGPKRERGRPSTSTPEKDAEIRQRLLNGESGASIARAMGVSERRIGRIKREGETKKGEVSRLPTDAIREAAQKSVENDLNDPQVSSVLAKAGMEDRDLFFALKADITETALILSMAGKLGAISAKRLASMALMQLDKIKDPENLGEEGRNALQTFIAMQHASNIAAKLPTELMNIAARRGGDSQDGQTRTIKLINEPDIK